MSGGQKASRRYALGLLCYTFGFGRSGRRLGRSRRLFVVASFARAVV